jgi:hypothetical protein
MHDELTDIRNQQYENAVRQLENLEMAIRAQEAYEQSIRGLRLRSDAGSGSDIERHDPVNA